MPRYEGRKREPRMYEPHSGTLKIAGSTDPGKAAGKAICLLKEEGIDIIDFFLVGGNANQQAMKAMSLFRIFLEDDMKGQLTLAFTPLHVRTMARNHENTGEMKIDATVWRTVMLTVEQSMKVLA